MAMTEPKINIAIALFVSLIVGALQPVFGILLGTILFKLEGYTLVVLGYNCQTIPDGAPTDLQDQCTDIHNHATMLCLAMFICAIVGFISQFAKIFSFGIISENLTLKIRTQLYFAIVRKSVGWFDDKDNAPGIISSTMASDTQTINGVCS
jgi:ABC-type multidrug transport system fused ATPase/permease subunit